jgi:hypothetical protein
MRMASDRLLAPSFMPAVDRYVAYGAGGEGCAVGDLADRSAVGGQSGVDVPAATVDGAHRVGQCRGRDGLGEEAA